MSILIKKTKTVKDQLGRSVSISFPPTSIVSLVPSQTELLADLGLEDEVVGITKFCVHPHFWFESKKRIGGTKTLNKEAILALKPDLILANKEENTKEDIEWAMVHFPTWVSDIKSLDDALNMILSIGEITDSASKAKRIVHAISDSYQILQSNSLKSISVVYMIWKNPLMAAGSDTFINTILVAGGFKNLVTEIRYPEITEEELTSLNPEVIFLSSEPFPFKGKHTEELKSKFPKLHFVEVDGELFSWYGSRLVKTASYLLELRRQITK